MPDEKKTPRRKATGGFSAYTLDSQEVGVPTFTADTPDEMRKKVANAGITKQQYRVFKEIETIEVVEVKSRSIKFIPMAVITPVADDKEAE